MIVVTGVGRSGTSAVARTLHEELDVPMGLPETLETEETRANPDGSYEDAEIRELHQRAGREPELRLRLRNRMLDLLIERRDELGEPFGVKDPRILDYPEVWNELVDDYLIICHRDLAPVVESWARVTAADVEEATSRVRGRLANMRTLLDGIGAERVLPLNMNEWREPEWIAARIEEYGIA